MRDKIKQNEAFPKMITKLKYYSLFSCDIFTLVIYKLGPNLIKPSGAYLGA
jgi:hypothetical protein